MQHPNRGDVSLVSRPHDGPVRVGLIGCGTQGRVHLRALRSFGEQAVEIAALCDLDATRLDEVGSEWPEARQCRDFVDMLSPGDLDLVILCTMPATHARIAVAILESGAHALVEKPFTMNLTEARTILDAAEVAQRQVQVGTNMRYMPDNQYIRQCFADGRIGEAMQCRVWVAHHRPPWWGPHYHKAVSGGGVLASTLVHPLDLALWTCDYPQPVTVSASARRVFPTKRGPLASDEVRERYDAEDLIAGHVRFADGMVLQLDGNWVDDTGERSGFELIGTRGTLGRGPLRALFEGDDGKVTEEPVQLEDTPFAHRRTADLPGASAAEFVEDHGDRDLFSWGRSVAEQDAEIVGHILAGRRWTMQDRRQLLVLQQLIDACYESARRNCEIEVEPV
jgi:predicted dehydrogenase